MANTAPPPATAPGLGASAEPRQLRCVRHPGRETLVSCGRCGRPFCPDCLIHTPAGQRCYDCAGVRRDAPQRAVAAGFLKAMGVAALGSAVGGLFGSILFVLFAALASGSVAGQVLAPLVNRKSRPAVYVLGLVALVGGTLLGWLVLGLIRLGPLPAPLSVRLVVIALAALQNWPLWLFICVAAAAGYQRMR